MYLLWTRARRPETKASTYPGCPMRNTSSNSAGEGGPCRRTPTTADSASFKKYSKPRAPGSSLHASPPTSSDPHEDCIKMAHPRTAPSKCLSTARPGKLRDRETARARAPSHLGYVQHRDPRRTPALEPEPVARPGARPRWPSQNCAPRHDPWLSSNPRPDRHQRDGPIACARAPVHGSSSLHGLAQDWLPRSGAG